MNVAFVCRTDGRREHIEQTVQSVMDHVKTKFTYGVIVDDSGDDSYCAWLRETFPFLEILHHTERRGLGGCFKSALEVVAGTDATHLFAVEDDTPILADISLAAMADVLDANGKLSQLMLMRPPFNVEEIAAGGVYQLTPDAFTERTDGTHHWVTHEKWFGYQPFLCKRSIVDFMLAHPSDYLELGVTTPLKDAGYNFGYWGGLNDEPLCNHVGVTRHPNYRW